MQVKVNKKNVEISDEMLLEVMADLGYTDQTGIAVALNGRVIPRGKWADYFLKEGDELDIIVATQGG